MSRLFLLVPLAILSLEACSAPATVDREAIRATLRDIDGRYSKAALGKDRAAFVALYASDAVMYPPGDATITGLENIGKLADTFWADPAFAATFTPVAIEVSADGSMGYTLNAGALTSTGPDKKPATEHIRDFHVWRRAPDGGWKLAVDIWNAEPVKK